nr:RNA-directed DNA polymerase, eukaryota [Tanacetum cinerariifolium]
APQQGSCKRALWDYMSILLGQWNGDVIMMGHFNEVRSKDERRGSWFNPSSSRSFDQFIVSSGLVDVKMEGFEGFDDMVKRAWLLFSHSDGNRMIRFKKRLQDLKVIIRLWIKDKRLHFEGAKTDISKELQEIDKEMDSGVISDTNRFRRLDLIRQLHDIKDKEATCGKTNLRVRTDKLSNFLE